MFWLASVTALRVRAQSLGHVVAVSALGHVVAVSALGHVVAVSALVCPPSASGCSGIRVISVGKVITTAITASGSQFWDDTTNIRFAAAMSWCRLSGRANDKSSGFAWGAERSRPVAPSRPPACAANDRAILGLKALGSMISAFYRPPHDQ
jgi:hypothetical protein